jgi:hypothetical protein
VSIKHKNKTVEDHHIKRTDYCVLNVSDPLIEYQCTNGRCDAELYINDTVVYPYCKFLRQIKLTNMRCIDGRWNSTAVCSECGTLSAQGLPTWHVNIYHMNTQKCGGSLLSATFIVSAAHCFWHPTREILPASEFTAIAGIVNRDHMQDDVQKSKLSRIHTSGFYMDFEGRYGDDIAVVQLEKPFVYTLTVSPVCLDYTQHDSRIVTKLPRWGRNDMMQMIDLISVPILKCINEIRWDLIGFITSDKDCVIDGSELCLGDGGNGLVYTDYNNRHFLIGVVSRFLLRENTCNMFSITLYTNLYYHIKLIDNILAIKN